MGLNRRKVIIYGTNENAKKIFRKIRANTMLGYDFIGFVGKQKIPLAIGNDINSIIRNKKPNTVFIAKNKIDNDELIKLIMTHPTIEFKVVPPIIEALIKVPDYDEFKDIPLIEIPPSVNNKYIFFKRLIDIFVSASMISMLSPLLMVVIVLLMFSGNPIFVQNRVGISGKEFKLMKFRTMKVGAQKALRDVKELNQTKVLFKSDKDPRITFLGKILRRTCIDELPQLFNVLIGEMSLVGPRPHLKSEISEFKDWQKLRLKVKPGLTGLWQVTGRHNLDFDRSVALDLYYIKNVSFWMDLKILAKTIPSIVFSRGIW